MDLTVGQARLKNAMQTLLIRFEETKPLWDDAVRRDFDREHIEPLQPAVRSALGGMERLSSALVQIRRDCS